MYDQIQSDKPNGNLNDDGNVELLATDDQSAGTNSDATNGDQIGVIANFIRDQPVLTLSIAFGLGLLATSLLARKRS